MKRNILIIDNSVAFTGALKNAIEQAKLLSGSYGFVFLIPKKNTVFGKSVNGEIRFYQLPMVEISRSLIKNLLYGPLLVFNYFRLRRIVNRERISIIQVNDFYNLLGAVMKMSGFKGKLITYVRLLPATRPAVIRNLWIKMAIRYSYRVVAVSDAILKQLPAAANITRIYSPAIFREKILQPQLSQGEEVRLLYLSNYIRGKGQDFALKAFAAAYKKNRFLRLKFAGDDMGLEKNRRFKLQLQQEAEKRSLKNIIEFSDFVTDVEKEIKEADIILNFSEAESFSMTCAESSFYGKPVIATRCGGPEEIILHGKTGLLVKNRDIEEMTAAILQLAGDKKKRAEWGAAGRKYVEEKFSIEKFTSAMLRILE